MNGELITFTGPHRWNLTARYWKVENPLGTVVGMHGYSEHSGRYCNVAKFFNLQGFDVIFMDHPGHGTSEGRRSNVDDFNDYVRSAESFMTLIKARKLMRPFHVLAHSLGGLIAIRFLETSPWAKEIRSLSLSSPLLGLGFLSARYLSWLKTFVSLLPNVTIPTAMIFGEGDLTHDEAMMEDRRVDPLISPQVTMHWVREFVDARQKAFKDINMIKVPVGLFQAGDETIVDRIEAERFFDELKVPLKRKIVYESFYHEILNESARERVFEDILQWMKEVDASFSGSINSGKASTG